ELRCVTPAARPPRARRRPRALAAGLVLTRAGPLWCAGCACRAEVPAGGAGTPLRWLEAAVFLTDRFLPSQGRRVAVVGSGCAGLAAAWHLHKSGCDVTRTLPCACAECIRFLAFPPRVPCVATNFADLGSGVAGVCRALVLGSAG